MVHASILLIEDCVGSSLSVDTLFSFSVGQVPTLPSVIKMGKKCLLFFFVHHISLSSMHYKFISLGGYGLRPFIPKKIIYSQLAISG